MRSVLLMLKGWYPRVYRHCSCFRLILAVWLSVILWNEYFVFVFYAFRWSTLKRPSSSLQNPVIVLFVADPQIIGLHDEPPNIGPISRWDSDRYLQQTFSFAYKHAKPDVVVFLGDLLDEGSQASPEDYETYIKRFRMIFNIPSHTQTVYIPGDNDVGGEGFDPKEPYKLAAFNQHFMPGQIPPKDVINVQFLDFLRLDLAPHEVVAARIQHSLSSMRQQSTATYRILCSHITIIDRLSNDQNEIISLTGADVLFSAHTHHSNIIACNDCGSDGAQNRGWKNFQGIVIPVYDYKIYHLDMNNKEEIYEIQVPTCSYRMGVSEMGYGLASFEPSGSVQYTVLWLPKRYSQLLTYVAILVGTVLGVVLVVSSLIMRPVCHIMCHYLQPYFGKYCSVATAHFVIAVNRLQARFPYHMHPPFMRLSAKLFKRRRARLKKTSAMV